MSPWRPPEPPEASFPELPDAQKILMQTGRLVIGCKAPLYAQQLAQSLLAQRGDHYAYIAFWDSRNDNDAILCMAAALGCSLNATLVDIATTLQSNQITAILCVGMSNRCLSIVDTLSSLYPDLSILLIGDPQLQSTIHHSLSIDHFEDPEQFISEQELLRTAEGILAYLPAGLDLPHTLDPKIAFPSPPGWLQIHPNLASYLRERLDPRPLIDILSRHLDALLSMANGAPLPANIQPPHFFALRWLAETTLDDALSLQATLAQARVLMSWAHYEAAQSLLETTIGRSPKMHGRGMGLITAAIAECLHCSGQYQSAQHYFTQAAAYAKKDGDHKAQIFIMRQHAEALRSFGHFTQSEQLLKEALSKASHHHFEAERRAILSTLSAIAITHDQIDFASNILEQTLSAHPKSLESVNQRLRLADVAYTQGKIQKAQRILVEAENFGVTNPQIMANILHRRSFFFLMATQYEQCLETALTAVKYFKDCGSFTGLASLYRILGTAYAQSHHPQKALDYYREALVLQLQLQDISGLKKSLRLTMQLLQEQNAEQEDLLHRIAQELEPLLTS